MKKIKQKTISSGLKLVANNKTANKFANKKLKQYADNSDNKAIKFIANNKIANKLANKTLKVVANNPSLNKMACDIIDKKL